MIGTAHTAGEIRLILMLPIKLCSCLFVFYVYVSGVSHLAYIAFGSTSSNLTPVPFGHKEQVGGKYLKASTLQFFTDKFVMSQSQRTTKSDTC